MQVKKIHFVESIPGQPVYEMENGEIRVPFPDGKTGAILWLTYDEVEKSLTKKTPENIKMVMDQFYGIKQQISGKKVHTLTVHKRN